ncbi:MAG: ATP-binding cassette domain-containing protein [Lachnospiraceae bacterium]|nr:ATP-binding cassette domain-containing protein [Lachnospiraceae bacterium]
MSDTGNERTEYCIVVDHVSKSFGEEQVLKDVSRSFTRGKIHGIVGNNGSGKTVLMKCIVGFLHPDSGAILVEGRRVGRDMDFPDNLGIIIETPGFLPNRTGVKNLQLLADLQKKIRLAEIKESIRRVGLDPDMKKPVGKYSLGMRQRLGIAQAIMEDPQILILDEPFNGLDKAVAGNMRRLLLELKAEGKTILLASHNQADIDQLCDTVCEMDAGIMTMIREDEGERMLLETKETKAASPDALIPELDLLDNAAILLAGQGVRRRERRRAANQVFERLGLSGVRHARPPMVTEKQRELVMEARELVRQEYEEAKTAAGSFDKNILSDGENRAAKDDRKRGGQR